MSCKNNKKRSVKSNDHNSVKNDLTKLNLTPDLICLQKKRRVDCNFSQQPTSRMPGLYSHQNLMDHGFSSSTMRQRQLDDHLSTSPRYSTDFKSHYSHPLSPNFLSENPTSGLYRPHFSDGLLSYSDLLQKLNYSALINNEMLPAHIRSLEHQDLLQGIAGNRGPFDQTPLLENPVLQRQLINESSSLRLSGAQQILEELMTIRNTPY